MLQKYCRCPSETLCFLGNGKNAKLHQQTKKLTVGGRHVQIGGDAVMTLMRCSHFSISTFRSAEHA